MLFRSLLQRRAENPNITDTALVAVLLADARLAGELVDKQELTGQDGTPLPAPGITVYPLAARCSFVVSASASPVFRRAGNDDRGDGARERRAVRRKIGPFDQIAGQLSVQIKQPGERQIRDVFPSCSCRDEASAFLAGEERHREL